MGRALNAMWLFGEVVEVAVEGKKTGVRGTISVVREGVGQSVASSMEPLGSELSV